MVFQNSNNQLFADTVKNEILFGLNNFKFEENFVRERFEWAMKFFDLEKYSDTSPLKLSGGEKKRLCLASVLAWDPEVIILDEPTVGQDELQKNKILSFIKELNQQNKTIIIISHDIEFLWNLRPNTIVMSNGEIIKIDSAENIFSKRFANKMPSIAVGAGTDALHLAYILAGLKKGDEVINSDGILCALFM